MRNLFLIGLLMAVGCGDPPDRTCAELTCDPLATCAVTAGVPRCSCPAAYTDVRGDGTMCVDIDECATGTSTCDAHAVCTNVAGAFTCACAAGFHGNGMTCAACTTCAAGTHETTACSASVDRVCGTCKSCNAGEFESGACSATADRACTACTAVAHCAATPTCTSASDSQCAGCDSNFYLVDGTADTCTACSGACPAGQYQSAACGATTDRVCSACASIDHCATTPTCTTASNQQCAMCDPTFYRVDGTADSCAPCSGACPGGSYQSAACGVASDRVCSTCSVCGAGTFQSAACTPTANTVCTACPAHCTTCTDLATCQSCEPGYFGTTCQNLRPDCYAIFTNGGTTDGVYTVDPDGVGGDPGFKVYCDMTNGGWTQVNDQDIAHGYLPIATWLGGVTTTAPNGGQWGVLDKLSLFASTGGGFELKLTYGQTQTSYITWKQTADPMTGAAGTLSNVVGVPAGQMGCAMFQGLAKRGGTASLDGDTLGCWWFAVGTSIAFTPQGGGTSGIPAYQQDAMLNQLVTDRVRLWVRKNGP